MGYTNKVLLITESYPPILNSAGRLFSELAETFFLDGLDVVVLTEKPSRYLAETGSHAEGSEEKAISGLRVIRLLGFPGLRTFRLLRYIEQLLKMVMYFVVGLFYGRGRQVIVYSPPLPLAVTGIVIAKINRTRSIINIQDIYPDTAIVLGFMRNPMLIRMGRWLERWVYRHADCITVHSEGNKNRVEQNGAAASKVSVIHNWVDLEKYVPGPLHNGFRKKYNLNGKFVVSYAGVIGLAQGMASLLSAAEAYCNDDRVYFVIAGKGVGYDEVKSLVCKKDFKNVLFLPHLVEEEYIELLRSSDVCLVTLSKNLTTPAIPGKLQCIMAVGRPVICSVPAVSGAKGIVEQAECGIWIDPSDETALSHAIGEMMKLDSLGTMGARGRMYASQCFDRKSCTEIYSDLLRKR